MKHFKPWCIPAYFTNNCYTDCFRRIKSNKTIKLQKQKKRQNTIANKIGNKKNRKKTEVETPKGEIEIEKEKQQLFDFLPNIKGAF